MSKRTELQKEFYKEIGNYKGVGRYNDRYVKWLEDKILAGKQGQTLPLDSVSCFPTNNLRYKKRKFTTAFGYDTILMVQQMWKLSDGSEEWRWVEEVE